MSEPLQHASVDYMDGEGESPADYPTLDKKLEKALGVIETALEQYENPAVMWTGGKDSTLALYLTRELVDAHRIDMPVTVFIDHFQHFEAVMDFADHWSEKWGLDLVYARNEELNQLANGEPGATIDVDELGEENRREVREKLGYEDESFPFLLDTYVGNHLLKTVPLNDTIAARNIDGIISGVRWDEQDARADETFFSPRHDSDKFPPHDRIHPILQFEESAVWDATWEHVVPNTVPGFPIGHVPQNIDDIPGGWTANDIPVSPKYFEGFRSLGSEVSTEKTTSEPAWLQDMEHTTERAGRAQDKEDLMERLRDLGYM